MTTAKEPDELLSAQAVHISDVVVGQKKKVSMRMYDEAFDAVSALLLEQYRKQKQAELTAQTDTTEEN